MTSLFRVLFVAILFVSFAVDARETARPSTPRRTTTTSRPRSVEAAPAARPTYTDDQLRTGLSAYVGGYMDEGFDKLQNMTPTCFDCDPTTTGVKQPSQQCRDTYGDMFKNDTIDIRYMFGYIDNYSAEDGPAREAAAETLLRPCGGHYRGACGFRYESDDDNEILVKTMRGPDGKEKTVRITLTNSSVSPNLRKNRNELAAAQAAQSARMRRMFDEGLRNSDMMIYVGHGRDGGGPAFEPGVLRQNTLPGAAGPGLTREGAEAINFDYYRTHRESRSAMLASLRAAIRPPKLFGMFACNTERFFADDIAAAATRNGQPQTGFVGSTGYTTFEAMYSQSMMMLDSVLALRCEGDFERAIHPIGQIQPDPNKPPITQTPPITRNIWNRRVPRAPIPTLRPAAPVAPAEPPAPPEEPVPTGETVRPPRPSVTLPAGNLSQPMRPSGEANPSPVIRDGDR